MATLANGQSGSQMGYPHTPTTHDTNHNTPQWRDAPQQKWGFHMSLDFESVAAMKVLIRTTVTHISQNKRRRPQLRRTFVVLVKHARRSFHDSWVRDHLLTLNAGIVPVITCSLKYCHSKWILLIAHPAIISFPITKSAFVNLRGRSPVRNTGFKYEMLPFC